MISPEEAKKRAKENFLSGFNCAQSVLEVFCGELGIDRELALKSAQAFGGGTCRLREMCGAVNGMLLALSIKNGSSDFGCHVKPNRRKKIKKKTNKYKKIIN